MMMKYDCFIEYPAKCNAIKYGFDLNHDEWIDWCFIFKTITLPLQNVTPPSFSRNVNIGTTENLEKVAKLSILCVCLCECVLYVVCFSLPNKC